MKPDTNTKTEEFSFHGILDFAEKNPQENTHETDGYIWRPQLNIVFLLDTSGSMTYEGGHRINQLNTAMRLVLDQLREFSAEEEICLYVRIIAFNSAASWVMGSTEKGVEINEACNSWVDLSAGGATDTAGAIRLARTAMRTAYMGTNNYHPVVILITDGESNDPQETRKAIEELREALSGGNPNKKDKVWRFAIGVEGYNERELVDFAMTGNLEDEFGNTIENVPMVLRIENATALVRAVRSVTMGAVRSSVAWEDKPWITV